MAWEGWGIMRDGAGHYRSDYSEMGEPVNSWLRLCR
jgi:hypothetical protein